MVPKTPQTVPRAWGADQAKLHERDRLREDWRLFEGMTLARSGGLPTGGDFAYEVKWDGFRTIVSTEGLLRVASDAPGRSPQSLRSRRLPMDYLGVRPW
jgi:hypothetical protein